jgi:hypothetical protein
MEGRVLLSTVTGRSVAPAEARAELRAVSAPTSIANVSGQGIRNGTATLTATLSSRGSGLAGKMVRFQIGDVVVGRARTNAQGIATLDNVFLGPLKVGTYTNRVLAAFPGNATLQASTRRGPLTVYKSATTLDPISASGLFGSTTILSTTLKSGGTPLAGKTVSFQLNGRSVGNAKTDADGVAILLNVSLAGLNAGNYSRGVTATYAGNATVRGSSTSGLLSIGQVAVGITLSGLAQTYDGTSKAVTVTTNPAGAAVALTYTNSSGVAVANPKDAGSYTVKATIAGSNNFGSATGTLVIAPKSLSTSGITAVDKVYDGTTAATLEVNNAALVGVVPGDDVTADFSTVTGDFASKTAGTNKVVTISGLTLGGPSAANYSLAGSNLTANITPAPVTVTGITATKVYDGTTIAALNGSQVTYTGVVSGDQVTIDLSGAIGTFDTAAAGQNKTVSTTGAALSGADAGNYTLVQLTGNGSIAAKVLTVGGVTASDKTYDGTTTATVNASGASLIGAIAGDDVVLQTGGATGMFTTKDAGTNKFVSVSGLSLGGAQAANYVLGSVGTSAQILEKALDVTGITANNKTYDGTTAATVNTSNAALQGVVSGDTVVLQAAGATGTFASKDVGTGKVVTVNGLTLSGIDASNYTISTTEASANITAKALTVSGITANDKPFDGTTAATLNTSGSMLEGVESGDIVALDVSNAVGQFDTPDPGTNKVVTITGLVVNGADSGNYTVTQPTTTASITT